MKRFLLALTLVVFLPLNLIGNDVPYTPPDPNENCRYVWVENCWSYGDGTVHCEFQRELICGPIPEENPGWCPYCPPCPNCN